MRVGIYGRKLVDANVPYVKQLFEELEHHSVGITVHKDFLPELQGKVPLDNDTGTFSGHSDLVNNIDYLLSLGGDGTLLDTVTLVKGSGIPVLGINVGRLGFLSSVGKEEVKSAIEALISSDFKLDKRDLLQLQSNKPLFEPDNFALNEFTVHRRDTAAMIVIHTFINGEFLNSFWSDGLIVSTSTGSTAYSLSCGGPILVPSSKTFVITPVAPHHLNVRPIIVPDDSVLEFEIEGRQDSFLCSLDSRHKIIDSSFHLAIRKEAFSLNLVRLNESNFLSTLRNKLLWGFDRRNN